MDFLRLISYRESQREAKVDGEVVGGGSIYLLQTAANGVLVEVVEPSIAQSYFNVLAALPSYLS